MSIVRLHSRSATQGDTLPRVSPLLLEWFARYTRWYLRRHFHNLRLSNEGWLPDTDNGIPKVIFLNHASWWDPLVCLHLWRQSFYQHRAYAPIDARALAQYPFFKKLGFFGVEADSSRGAADFLRIASGIANTPRSLLWVTPQARFADVRERPLLFRHGLGHLAHRFRRLSTGLGPAQGTLGRLQFIPLAIEYTHWQERLPEVLLRFGSPIEVNNTSAANRTPQEWTRELEGRLEGTMEALSAQACQRDPSKFLNLLRGKVGVGGFYDVWRRCRAFLGRSPFEARHGSL
ncbi:MAG: lysophospholipid acyltransferase family protein [Verrucomicrobiales bacterium]|nr:lysophospholipid acyltransferase family protein [Verrucomicrobiales bacterium]